MYKTSSRRNIPKLLFIFGRAYPGPPYHSERFPMASRFAAALVAALVLFSASVFADDRDFTVVNGTGYDIKGLFINPPGDNVFNENELKGVLGDGNKFDVKFTGADKGCTWNMKVTWTDDSSSIFRGLDLCKISTVTLKYNKATDTASYTWD